MIREMVVAPVVLEGQHIRLEPLQKNHLAGLAAVGLDPELWRWIPRPVRTIDEMAGYIETALREKEQGASLPFALVERQTGRPIGITSSKSATTCAPGSPSVTSCAAVAKC